MAKQWSVADMEKRVARFKKLTPHPVTFLDQALPHHKRDVFNLIGRGVSEEKEAAAEITDVRDFNVQMSRAKPGHGAGLHSHKTIETFMPLNGTWSIFWGDQGESEIILEQFDLISVPPGVMRGFKNVGQEDAFLFTVLGGTDPGRVTWSPELIRQAAEKGWVLDESGDLKIPAKAE
jgi:uncharacterized RmlC-like cupin family protein